MTLELNELIRKPSSSQDILKIKKSISNMNKPERSDDLGDETESRCSIVF